MNRKDTMIVAVVVNMALLVTLFVTAKKVDKIPYAESNFVDSPMIVATPSSASAVPGTGSTSNVSHKETAKDSGLVKQFLSDTPTVVNKETVDTASSSIKEAPTAISKPDPGVPATPYQEKIAVEEYISIVVKKGDFLERIARANHTTVAKLMEINGLTTTQLKIGQVLKVPVSQGAQYETTTDTTSSVIQAGSPSDYYTVKEGDSPWSIALRHRIRLDDLLRMNDLDEQKARCLKPGDQLRIR